MTDQATIADRFTNTENLIENDEFWAAAWETYRGQDLALPIEVNQFSLRDLTDALTCPPGKCGHCCTHYKQVQVSPRDIERIEDATGLRIAPLLSQDGDATYLRIENGCPFLQDNACRIYKHRPDACYWAPIQMGYNFDAEGKPIDPRIHIRIECLPALVAVRTTIRRILRANPGATLLPTLAISQPP